MVIDRTTDTEYRRSVRNLLGVDRDDDITLSDADIDDVTVLDMAEMEVVSLLPATTDLTDKRVRLAVIYTAAALLCPSMPSRVEIEVKGIDSGWKKKSIDYDDLANELRGRVVSLLDPLMEAQLGGDSDLFRIAPSKRAVTERETF